VSEKVRLLALEQKIRDLWQTLLDLRDALHPLSSDVQAAEVVPSPGGGSLRAVTASPEDTLNAILNLSGFAIRLMGS